VPDQLTLIKQYEDQIEDALVSFEIPGDLMKALAVYQVVESDLEALAISSGDVAHAEYQRVIAYCLLRQGNILRQMGQTTEAQKLSEREVAAARASGDQLTLARSLMSNGTNMIVGGELEEGLTLLEEARTLFEAGDNDEFKQGLGWYWILQADLGNAGIIELEVGEIVGAADHALENWPGIARGYAARAKAYETLGDEATAEADRQKQNYYEAKAGSSKANS
jgi:tetratricopeptide (TPR) repeat protein